LKSCFGIDPFDLAHDKLSRDVNGSRYIFFNFAVASLKKTLELTLVLDKNLHGFAVASPI